MSIKDNTNNRNMIEKEIQGFMLTWFLSLFGEYSRTSRSWKKYYSLLNLIPAGLLLSQLVEIGKVRLVEHLKKVSIQSQSNRSKQGVVITFDKTCDGPRYGNKQTRAHKQYTGSYGVICTHGWFFLVGIIGSNKNSEIIFLGASLYEKGFSEAEWKEGQKLLEEIGVALNEAGISRDMVTVVGDHAYMSEDSQTTLAEKGWIYVGKAGGRQKEELNGQFISLAEHAKRYWGGYRDIEPQYHAKTKVIKYTRAKSQMEHRIYFHGLFPRKYQHWVYYKRFLVTNWLSATAQWAFEKYNQRWQIEVFFRNLKQVCGWRKYHPQNSGNKYKVHTAFVILTYTLLSMIRSRKREFGSYTIGMVKREVIKQASENGLDIEFLNDFLCISTFIGIKKKK